MAFSLLPKTFDEIKTYVVNKIQTKYPALGSFLTNSFLIIFVDALCWAVALFMDFSDSIFSEGRLFSAVQYENARIIAKFYGYEAHRKISAQGIIKIGMTSDFNTLPDENITFNKYDSLTIAGINYLVLEDTTFSSNALDDSYDGFPAGTYYIEVPVIQGQLITVEETSSGEQNEVFNLDDDSVENTIFEFYVNDTEWTEVDSFFLSEATDQHYIVENVSQMAGVKAEVGDGYKGAQLEEDDEVVIKYVRTNALEGQIKSTGLDVIFNESYQYTDTTPVEFYGITISQMIGADEIEDIDSIKYWGQKAASSLSDKAFTDDEVQLALQEFGGILKSKAISEYDLNPITPTEAFMNVVNLLVVPTAGTIIDDVTKQRIRDYLRSRMDFTDFIQFIDVEYINIFFVLDMEVYNNAPSDLNSQIDTYLQTTYALGELDFGQSLDHSSVVYKIKHNFKEYIKRFNITLKVYEEFTDQTPGTGGDLDYTLLIGGLQSGQDNIKQCTIVVSFTITGEESKTETLVDNGSGSFIPQSTGSSQFIDSGTIDYETGEITLTVDSEVVTIPSLEFQYETYDVDGKEENVDIKYNQIVQYGKARIDSETV